MESSIIKYSETQTPNAVFRIDAEHYRKRYLMVRDRLISGGALSLKDCIKQSVITGHTPSMKNDSYYGGNINFIKTDNLRENEITADFTDKLSEAGNKIIRRSSLKEKDIIVTIIGASYDIVGRACLVQKKDLPANINQNIALIRVPDKIYPEYLTIYLNSYYGRNYLWFLSRQTEQVNLNCREVEQLLVPHASVPFQTLIAEIHNASSSLKLKCIELYRDCEQILLSELGILNWKPKYKQSFIRNYSDAESADRIDAEYFQPMYDDLVELIKKYKGGYKTLGSVVKIKDKNFMPEDDVTYKYIELANISANGNINGFIEAKGKELPTRARRKVNTGDVIVSSIEGSLSCIALITDNLNNELCSTGFYVVNSDTLNSETLLVLLKSPAGQLQLKKGCSGTILTAISNDEFKKIILPEVSAKVQEDIKQKITEMYKSKALSKSLLEIAKSGVEMAIEKSEEEALKWINQEVEACA